MKIFLILTLCILGITLLTGGCINDIIPLGDGDTATDPSEYEFDVFLNGMHGEEEFVPVHTFYLSKDGYTKAVSMVENKSVLNIVPMESLRTSSEGTISDIVILGQITHNTNSMPESFTDFSRMQQSLDINYTTSEKVIRGQKNVFIEFEEPVTGFVAYTMSIPQGHDFMYVTTPPSIVRFVLPEGYTTGNPLIGRPKPTPDSVYHDTSGRENLVWYNDGRPSGFMSMLARYSDAEVEPIPKLISVKFYTTSAPRNLAIAVIILGLISAYVFLRYRAEKQRLEDIRKGIEKQVKLPKKKGKE